jgi:hypothetical protein
VSRLALLVTAACGGALAIVAASVIVAVSASGGADEPHATPVPDPTVCLSDPDRPDGANGCEQDPMVVCMADHHYADQATDAATRRTFTNDAAAYCADAINNIGR